MMNRREANCSKFREEIRRKSLLEKEKKAKINKLNKKENCREIKSSLDKSPERKIRKIVQSTACRDDSKLLATLLAKIKPPLSEREKYANSQHVVCFSENTQNKSPRKQNGIIYTTAESKSCEGETQKSKRKKVTNGDNSWCKASVNKSSKSLEAKCDSACSFDSIIDLEGLALTSEELKRIEENRLKVHPPKEIEEGSKDEIKTDQDNAQGGTKNEESEEIASEEKPVEETPVAEKPVEETPIEETPVEETTVEETPVEKTSVEETVVEKTPVEETPAENTETNE